MFRTLRRRRLNPPYPAYPVHKLVPRQVRHARCALAPFAFVDHHNQFRCGDDARRTRTPPRTPRRARVDVPLVPHDGCMVLEPHIQQRRGQNRARATTPIDRRVQRDIHTRATVGFQPFITTRHPLPKQRHIRIERPIVGTRPIRFAQPIRRRSDDEVNTLCGQRDRHHVRFNHTRDNHGAIVPVAA